MFLGFVTAEVLLRSAVGKGCGCQKRKGKMQPATERVSGIEAPCLGPPSAPSPRCLAPHTGDLAAPRGSCAACSCRHAALHPARLWRGWHPAAISRGTRASGRKWQLSAIHMAAEPEWDFMGRIKEHFSRPGASAGSSRGGFRAMRIFYSGKLELQLPL